MDDLKLIDELLLDSMRADRLTPNDLWNGRRHTSSVQIEAIKRLAAAWGSGEMDELTLTWANFFKTKGIVHPKSQTNPIPAPAEKGGSDGEGQSC